MWFGKAIAALVRSPCFEATEKSVYPLVVNSTFLFLLQNGSVINTIGLFASFRVSSTSKEFASLHLCKFICHMLCEFKFLLLLEAAIYFVILVVEILVLELELVLAFSRVIPISLLKIVKICFLGPNF
jgi:hypothetical protein